MSRTAAAVLSLLLAAPAAGAPARPRPASAAAAPDAGPGERIELSSDTLELEPGSRTARATGNVVARRGALEVRCAAGQAVYGEDRRIARLELEGSVHVERSSDGLVADAARATWDAAGDVLALSGDAVLHRGRDRVRGERIVVENASDRIEVDRARVTLAPRGARPGDDADAAREVQIRAPRLVVTEQRRKVRFEGGVQLSRGALTATADRLEAAAAGPVSETARDAELSSLVLAGRVKVLRGSQEATCARATLDPATGDLRLEGSPVLRDGDSEVRGERIVVDGATGRSRVESASARIRGKR